MPNSHIDGWNARIKGDLLDETQSILALLNASFPRIAAMDPLEARSAVDARITPADNLDAVRSVEDRVIISENGNLDIRVYRPHEPAPPAPVTVYAHGGGFLHGSIAGHDRFCRIWAARTGSIVVSVNYRLAPEHSAPTPLYDLAAAAEWAHDQGLAGNGLVLAGDSAGANLAAAAGILLRDRGTAPVTGQVLLYPMLDPDMSSDSYRRCAEGYFITSEALAFYWRTYLGSNADGAARDWRIAPQSAADLTGLPPSITVTAGLDPLCDEGQAYSALLRRAGNTALHRHYPDQFHGFLTMPKYSPGASAQEILWADFRCFFVKDINS